MTFWMSRKNIPGLKAPRYDDKAMEVGPLARMLIGYASGHERTKFWVDAVLTKLNAPATVLFSTLGRVAARCIETVLLAEKLEEWTDELAANIAKGDLASMSRIIGILLPGQRKQWAGVTPKPHVAHLATGSISKTEKSPIIRQLCPPPGMRPRGMPPGCRVLMKLR